MFSELNILIYSAQEKQDVNFENNMLNKTGSNSLNYTQWNNMFLKNSVLNHAAADFQKVNRKLAY